MNVKLRRAATVLGAGLVGVGLVAAGATPASATVTPRYGMTCYTGTSGSLGGYQGYADCYSPYLSKWKVRVNCSYGGTYDSLIYYTDSSDGWFRGQPPQTCYWGVNSVTVIELA